LTALRLSATRSEVRAAALVAGLGGALAARVGASGVAGARSVPGGLLFAVLLLVLAAVGGAWWPDLRFERLGYQIGVGAGGAALLCLVPLAVHLRAPGGALRLTDLPVWAALVTAVAVGEEVVLRGALWHALERRQGALATLLITTTAFGLMHVPLYGWSALPLDLAVGLLLGAMRLGTGGVVAPAVAHTLADLAGWWLR